jgi:hypothetical protein
MRNIVDPHGPPFMRIELLAASSGHCLLVRESKAAAPRPVSSGR